MPDVKPAAAKRATWVRYSLVLAIAAMVLAVHGYHYGIEDESIYLPAVKRLLNGALFPHDFQFFEGQARLTLFPWMMAGLSRMLHLAPDKVFLGGYCVTTCLFVLALRQLAERFFPTEPARWAAVLLPAGLYTMPVAGTALFIMDQHLHPRNIEMVAMMFALVAVLDGRRFTAAALMAFALAMHPLMALYGLSLLGLFLWRLVRLYVLAFAIFLPLAWHYISPVSPAWQQAVASYYFLPQWEWYEWLGIVGPLAGLMGCARWASSRSPVLANAAWKLIQFGGFFFLVALVATFLPHLAGLTPLQPMRCLQPIYLFLWLFTGGILVQTFTGRVARLVMAGLFVGLCGGMFLAQRNEFPGESHIEWPWAAPRNEWLQAFDWVRLNTPPQAYFVMDPQYMEHAGEDFHGFRGLAERGMLADNVEDRTVAVVVPALADEWWTESQAERQWAHFGHADLMRLKQQFGVDWVLFERDSPPDPGDAVCPYQNPSIRICRIE